MTPTIEIQTIGAATQRIIAIIIREHRAARAKPTANTGHVFMVSSTID